MTDRILRSSLTFLPLLVTLAAGCSSSDDTTPGQTGNAGGSGGSSGAGGSSVGAGGSAGTTSVGGHGGSSGNAGSAGTGAHAGTSNTGGNGGGGAGTGGGGHTSGGSGGTTAGAAGAGGSTAGAAGVGGEGGGAAGHAGEGAGGSAGGTGGTAGTGGLGGMSAGGSGGMTGSGIGDPCMSMGMFDMGTCAKGQFCIPDGAFGFKGGYCTGPCDDANPCPTDAACIPVGQGSGMSLCFKSCMTSSDCRTPDYECNSDDVCQPPGSGNSGSDGSGVTPGTANGMACVLPVVSPPGQGSLFEKDQQISTGTHEADCQLAVDPTSKHVVVAWTDVAKGGRKIGMAASLDDGKTFGPQVELPLDQTVDKNAQQVSPVVAVDPDGAFYVSFLGYDPDPATGAPSATNVYVAKLSNDGTLDKLQVVTPAGESAPAYTIDKPWIVADAQGTLWMSWDRSPTAASGTVDIRLVRSTDHGDTWSAPITISDSDDRAAYDRDLAQIAAMPGGGVVAAWVEIGSTPFGGLDNHVYTQRIAADGTKTGKNVLVTGDTDSPSFMDPSLAVSGNNVYVAFNSGTIDGDWDVRVSASIDGGLTFSPSVKANDDATCATHYLAQLAADGSGNLHVVYNDNRYLVGNVFHQSSAPATALAPLAFGPATFVSTASFPFSTNTTGKGWIGQYLGFVAVGSELYAAWPDARSKTSHIFFAHGVSP